MSHDGTEKYTGLQASDRVNVQYAGSALHRRRQQRLPAFERPHVSDDLHASRSVNVHANSALDHTFIHPARRVCSCSCTIAVLRPVLGLPSSCLARVCAIGARAVGRGRAADAHAQLAPRVAVRHRLLSALPCWRSGRTATAPPLGRLTRQEPVQKILTLGQCTGPGQSAPAAAAPVLLLNRCAAGRAGGQAHRGPLEVAGQLREAGLQAARLARAAGRDQGCRPLDTGHHDLDPSMLLQRAPRACRKAARCAGVSRRSSATSAPGRSHTSVPAPPRCMRSAWRWQRAIVCSTQPRRPGRNL